MTAATLRALAARCMELDGPCRETDFWISVRVNGSGYTDAELQADIDIVGIDGMVIDAAFTASLDAAMLLAPCRDANEILNNARLNLARNEALHVRFYDPAKSGSYAQKLARYVTAAALLARAAVMEAGE